MMLDEDETQTVSTALYQYQSTIDRLKFISRNLKDAVEWQGVNCKQKIFTKCPQNYLNLLIHLYKL